MVTIDAVPHMGFRGLLPGIVGERRSPGAPGQQASEFYSLLLAEPGVRAVTWWDFSDLAAWQGAPAGLLDKDMSPKPLYHWLMENCRSR
jgi:GH35 family endo-1,4-beta-xylanase